MKISGAQAFLPADNETGVVAYRISEVALSRIDQEGAAFFESLGPTWRGWKSTPIAMDSNWLPRNWNRSTRSPLHLYLSRYGFDIDVAPAVEDAVNDAIRKPGGYYRYGLGGSLVIIARLVQRAFDLCGLGRLLMD